MILLLGATGYVGQAFAAALRQRKIDFAAPPRHRLGNFSFGALLAYVRKSKPSFLINAIGLSGDSPRHKTSLTRADLLQANTLLPQTISRVCYLTNTPWAHVSAGNIFAGRPRQSSATAPDSTEGTQGFQESDVPNASFRGPHYTFYSGSKALGEEAILCNHATYIWRPAALFDESDSPASAVKRIAALINPPDVPCSLLCRREFVNAALDMMEAKAPFGTYHVANQGTVSLRELATQMRQTSGHVPDLEATDAGSHFGSPIEPATVLNTTKLNEIGICLRSLDEALSATLNNWPPSNMINARMHHL